MAETKDPEVDEQAMEKMSVPTSDPQSADDRQMESEAVPQDTSADAGSGVADQDPLSAHPS